MANPPILCHWPDGTAEVLNVAEPRTGFSNGCEVGLFRAATVRRFDEPRDFEGVAIEGEIWLIPLGSPAAAATSN
jgi:hypothetical protein